jgi:S-adenosylmethionine/arginine decarboxylase-like enzyme
MFRQLLMELGGIAPGRLTDGGALSSLVVAAAGAIGIATEGPPAVRTSHRGAAVGLVCREGHIVLHTEATAGTCLVDIVGRGDLPIERGLDVVMRKLEATSASPGAGGAEA